MRKQLKMAAFAALLAVGFTASAQTDPANSADAAKTGKNATAIRLIDNKGTIKYMQSNNGITTITSTAPGNRTVTTWQLGGELIDPTTITTNGNDFTIDGNTFKVQNIDQETGIASTATTIGTSGYTLLVRDEATGTVKKMLATSLITSGQTYFTATIADPTAPTAAELTFDVAAATAPAPSMTGAQIPLPTYDKVWVYRNGAKLIANLDYTISGSEVTLVPNSTPPNDWTVYTGDVIEVQYIK